ncbi:hypothetical protein ACIGHB_29580 [Streptomyces sp. NPDC085460]|uniref:hypothetical protein n=1 Tax=Streptomyces sp. NPDC085460 TaxID=3365723 RepID=UPI0037D709C9
MFLPEASDNDQQRAADYLSRLVGRAGDGRHSIIMSIAGIGGSAVHTTDFLIADQSETLHANLEEVWELSYLLACAIAGNLVGGIILRTLSHPEDTVRGWRVTEGIPQAMTGAELFDAYCFQPDGEIIVPPPGTECTDAFHILA